MDKYDTSQLTEFPRFEAEPSQSGVTTFLNKFWKLPLFSPSDGNDNVQNKPTSVDKDQTPSEEQNKPDYDDKLETGSYAVEFEGRSLPNVLKRISSLVASGSSGGTRYADTELARYWMPDDISHECYECAARFSTLRRRHHCRVCGQIFCSRCCSQRVPGQIFGCAGGLRVCNYCCNVVLSYLRENDICGDISPDLRTLQENLQNKFPDNKSPPPSSDKFMFSREQEERSEPRASKEALQDLFRLLSYGLPTQQHRFRLVRYNGVWRGCDILQWIMDNTQHKTRAQATLVCQSLLKQGHIECCTELAQFADYALYKPVTLPPLVTEDEVPPEEPNRLTESGSSYYLDLNLGDNSARLTKAAKAEIQPSPATEEENPVLEENEAEALESRTGCKAIAESGEDHLKLLLRQCLAREGLNSAWLDVLYPLCVQASEMVLPDMLSSDIDVRNYVQVKKVPGGSMSDSCLINGVVMTKNVAHRGMPQEILNPTILLLDCSIAYQRVEGKLTSLEPVLLQEREYLVRCAARLSALGAGVVLARGAVARPVQDALRNAGCALAVRVRGSALARVARCARADRASSVDARVALARLGTCGRFVLANYPTKTLMVLENCPESHLGGCILLRGAPLPDLVKVKKIAKFMLLACYNWKLEKAFLYDIDAVLPEPGNTFDTEMVEDKKPDKTKSESTVKPDDSQQKTKSYRKTESDKNLSCGVPIRDFSDPLRATQLSVEDDVFLPQEETVLKADSQNGRWSIDDVVLTMSPNVGVTAPHFETEPGIDCPFRQYFEQPVFPTRKQYAAMTPKTKRRVSRPRENTTLFEEPHAFVRNPITAPSDDPALRASLALYRATGCRRMVDEHDPGCPQYNPTVLKKQPQRDTDQDREREKEREDAFLDPLAPENHQRLDVLLFSYSNKSANVPDFCVNPWIMTIELYGRRDITLGAFLEQYCFNAENKCTSPNCQVPMNQHVQKFVHGDVCITITCNTIGHSNVDKLNDDQGKQVSFWSRCASCGGGAGSGAGSAGSGAGCTGSRRVGRVSLRWSLGAYLSWRVRGRGARGVRARCPHALIEHHHYIANRLTTACLRYSKITTWDVEFPPEVISINYNTKVMRDSLISQLNELMLKGHETFGDLTETEAEKDHQNFKQLTEELHLSLTSQSLQEQTTRAGVVRKLWQISDKVITAEKMLRDAHDKWSAPVKPSKLQDIADEKSEIDESGNSEGNNENADLLTKDESDRVVGDEDEEKGDKKTVRQILSQLLSNNQPSNQVGMIISHGTVPVAVLAGEVGSVAAATLASVTYQRTLHLLFSSQTEQDDAETSNLGKEKTDNEKPKATKSNDHIEVLLKDGLLCRVYYAPQFYKLRHLFLAPLTNNRHIADEFARSATNRQEHEKCCTDIGKEKYDSKSLCDIEEGFIRSLAHCVPWAACGGKSGSTFCKTKDDRYVLKEMTKPEWQQFLEFAPHYFSYVGSSHQNKQPTLLARILGVFSVCGAGNGVLVMENLLYDADKQPATSSSVTSSSVTSPGAALLRYDLKGTCRRLPPDAHPQRVLTDENMLMARWERPLLLRGGVARSLWAGTTRDTQFLARHCVMDYSLLLGVDNRRQRLTLGLIDYIRTFTWDKKLEHYVKKNLRSGQPTVVSPEQYKLRFRLAIAKYFPHCPDQWDHFITGLRHDIDTAD